uniref:Aminopeptidase P family protein n=1 Tax=Gracilinema caldarium TaxID=215591 RepID=A0A7C3IJ74_9SPIR
MAEFRYARQIDSLTSYMLSQGVRLIVFEDFEGHRDPTIRWLTNHPGDALLFVSSDILEKPILVPWDVNMAHQYAATELLRIIPYTDFERNPYKALKAIVGIMNIQSGSCIEIPPETSYSSFLRYLDTLPDYDILCREDGIHAETRSMRAIKGPEEIERYRIAARITNEVIAELEKHIKAGTFKTEIDVAQFIEREGRLRGCESTGFETLVAGPKRSFGIHAFPTYTGEPFGTQGLSIIDFGLKYDGYTTDVTITVARGPLSRAQERMLSLVEKAYNLAISMAKEGSPTRDIAMAVDAHFEKAKKKMPHALGHGIGVEAHEAPAIRNRSDNDWVLQQGMVFTLEPGLYDPVHGGCRLENDFVLTENGLERLTNAQIIRIPE